MTAREPDGPSVCVFGTYDAERHPRITVVDVGLRAHGVHPVKCNVPWRASTDERVSATRRPWIALRLVLRLVGSWIRLLWRSRKIHRIDVILVGYLGILDVHLARLRWPRATIILDHLAPAAGTLEDRALTGRSRGRVARWLDRCAVCCADIVLVDTEEHREAADHSVVVPVGASEEWFDAGDRREPTGRHGERLRVIFYGSFTPLQGAVTICRGLARALERCDHLEVSLVGSGQDHAACRSILGGDPRITWTYWVPSSDLPSLVATHDVCLGIAGTTAKAQRVVPNKVYQGAAAGCALITSDTSPQRRAFGDAAYLVAPGDADAVAQALCELVSQTDRLAELQSAARQRARARFTPRAVVRGLLEHPSWPAMNDR